MTYFSHICLYSQKEESMQAVNHLSGIRAWHGVWARILEKFRFKTLSVNPAKWTLIGVHIIIGLGLLTKKVDALKCWKQKRKAHGSFISSYDQQQMINDK